MKKSGANHANPQLVGGWKRERRVLGEQFLLEQMVWKWHTSLVLAFIQLHGTTTGAGSEVPCWAVICWLKSIAMEETSHDLGRQPPVCHPKELDDDTSLPGGIMGL